MDTVLRVLCVIRGKILIIFPMISRRLISLVVMILCEAWDLGILAWRCSSREDLGTQLDHSRMRSSCDF